MKKIFIFLMIFLMAISRFAFASLGSVVFDGSTAASIDMPAGASFGGSQSGIITISAWVKTSAVAAQWIFQQRNGGAAGANRLFMNSNGTITSRIDSADTCDASFTSITTINDGNWHNVLVTVPSNNVEHIYIDNIESTGSCSGTCSCTQTNLTSTVTQHIGRNYRDNNSIWNGKITEVATWNESLGTSDRTAVAKATTQGVPLTTDVAHLHFYYSLSECSNGSTCSSANMFIDQSSNAYNASPATGPVGSSDSPFQSSSSHINIINNATISNAIIQ